MVGFFNEVNPDQSGGKGKNLIELWRASFPVPPGFIITFEAHRQFQETGKMSREVKNLLAYYYRRLKQETGSPFVAVRSSASAEDLENASCAGQYETFLYVHSGKELLRRIVDCWNSLYSQKAAAYRQRMNIPSEDLEMAVVVQSMVEARSAGVLFTSQPYMSDHRQTEKLVVVESSWGCGETVVSGLVTPDYFEVAKNSSGTYAVKKKFLGKKDSARRNGGSGQMMQPTSIEERQAYSLTDHQLLHLCRLGDSIEHHFGSPQDIEWALDRHDRFFILQCRPVTFVLNHARVNPLKEKELI